MTKGEVKVIRRGGWAPQRRVGSGEGLRKKRGMSPLITCLPWPRALQTSLFLSLGIKMTLDEDIRSSTGKGSSPGWKPWMTVPLLVNGGEQRGAGGLFPPGNDARKSESQLFPFYLFLPEPHL